MPNIYDDFKNYICNCDTCEYGPYDSLSDICDNCTHDPDTGWFGFTDHSFSDNHNNPLHFNNEDEQFEFYNNNKLNHNNTYNNYNVEDKDVKIIKDEILKNNHTFIFKSDD